MKNRVVLVQASRRVRETSSIVTHPEISLREREKKGEEVVVVVVGR